MQNAVGAQLIPAAPGDGEQRRAAGAEQVAESGNDDNHREAKPHAAKRCGTNFGDAGDVHPINNIVQKVQQLRYEHGKGGLHDGLDNSAVFKVYTPQKGFLLL